MSKRKPLKAPARKASKRPSRARPTVDKTAETKAAHAAADFASKVLTGRTPTLDGNFLPLAAPELLTGDWTVRPNPPRLTREDIRTAREMVDTGAVRTIDDAFAIIRKECYGYSEPKKVVLETDLTGAEQINQSMAAAANASLSCSQSYNQSFSYSGNVGAGEAKVVKKLRVALPEQVFDTRRDLDVVHKQLRQLIFTLEPVLRVGPRCSLFQRTARPSSSKPDDHDELRDAELTYAVENIEESVKDLQVILAHLVSNVALPFQDDPDNIAATSAPPTTPYPG